MIFSACTARPRRILLSLTHVSTLDRLLCRYAPLTRSRVRRAEEVCHAPFSVTVQPGA
jgi:hypothetical protein